ncbi:MAG: peptidylprolyl isomerase [Deltaproteobacteria bacterium]|nr:peptidylprolyl isomerase [Deltaproteobacteria bacterium]
MLGRLGREPLLHFLLVGGLLFGAYRVLHPAPEGGEAEDRIVVTQDDLRQMSLTWLAQGRPPPTPGEMRSLVEHWVHDEVLYREALALGLDQGDTIVKRRMVQKMAFLADDLSDLREPTRAELEAWFAEHAARFTLPPRASFRQLYFSPDRRGAGARAGAEEALVQLAGGSVDPADATSLGDPFVLQRYYPERTPDQIAKDFGPGFAEALFGQEPGAWRGPIESGFGWHLVFLESLEPARVPDFAEVAEAVETAWVEEQRDAFERQAYETMKARYQIVLPDDLTPAPLVAAGAGGR